MKLISSILRFVLFGCIALAISATAALAEDKAPPNWKGGGTGTTHPEGGVDVDTFGGKSCLRNFLEGVSGDVP
jgi:hypothetical protein